LNYVCQYAARCAVMPGDNITRRKQFTRGEYLAVAKVLSLEKMQERVFALLSAPVLGVHVLVHGNVILPWAKTLSFVLKSKLALKNSVVSEENMEDKIRSLQIPVRQLPEGNSVLKLLPTNPDEENSAVVVIFQLGLAFGHPLSLRKQAQTTLLAALLREPCFHELRTVLQLGYIVQCFAGRTENVFEIRIVVQGAVTGPTKVRAHIQAFLVEQRQLLFSDLNIFNERVSAVRTELLQRDTKMAQGAARDWEAIQAGPNYAERDSRVRFDSRAVVDLHLAHISIEEMIELYDAAILGRSSVLVDVRMRALTVVVYGKFHANSTDIDGNDRISTMSEWW
jgi:secreted Zn-dependent insulinase-like peptidase